MDGERVQVVFFSILSVALRDTDRIRKTHLINRWLRGWCHRRNFGFFDHGAVYLAPGLMAADGVHPGERWKRIPAQELLGLIDRALN